MFEPLVDGEDYQLAGAAQLARHQDPREVGFGAGIVAFIMRQNLFNLLRDVHVTPL